MRKVLFLDIDGVLNTALWNSSKDKNASKDKWGCVFDPMSVPNLKWIVDEAGLTKKAALGCGFFSWASNQYQH